MVSNDEALEEITNSFMSGSKLPTIHISMSTVSPGLCDLLEKQHREQGVAFLAAPVSGRPERAKEGSLWIFLAGDGGAKKKSVPILQSMSEKFLIRGRSQTGSAF